MSYRHNKSWRTVSFNLEYTELQNIDKHLKDYLTPNDDIVDVKINQTDYGWIITAFIAEEQHPYA